MRGELLSLEGHVLSLENYHYYVIVFENGIDDL